MKANTSIREKAKNNGVRLWQIADALGIQESLFSKKLRHDLPQDETDKIFSIIEKISNEDQEAL